MIRLQDLTIDPEFKKLLPPGSEKERTELVENIKADGRFTDPVIVWRNHGIVIDGQTRFDIWQNDLASSDDIQPDVVEMDFASRDAVKAWMIRHQVGRRNWTPSQLAMMAATLATLKVGTNQHVTNEGGQVCPPSISSAAAEMGVSERSVKTARTVLSNGSDPLVNAVKDGTVTASDASHVTDLPKREQTAAVRAVRNGKARTVTEAAKPSRTKPAKKDDHAPAEREPGDESEYEGPSTSKKDSPPVPKCLAQVPESLTEFTSLTIAIGKIASRIEKLQGEPGGKKLIPIWSDIQRCLSQVQVYLKCYRFFSVCPDCKITEAHQKADQSCKLCRGHGWITKPNGMSAAQTQWLKEQGYDV